MPDQAASPAETPSPRPPLSVRNWLNTWRTLRWGDRFMIVEALVLLGIGRATVLCIPFKRIAPHLGQLKQETPTGTPSINARRVGKAIYLVSRHTPWKSNCFAQAIAGHMMLRRRKEANTLYMGATKKEGIFAAHAWIRNGDLVLTGGPGHERYTVLVCYGWQPRHPAPAPLTPQS